MAHRRAASLYSRRHLPFLLLRTIRTPLPAPVTDREAALEWPAVRRVMGPTARACRAASSASTTPLPDFTDCSFATPEADADWIAVVHGGGPVRAFDRRMPAFGEALTDGEIASASRLHHGRSAPSRVAARRAEPAARARHREGVSRERGRLTRRRPRAASAAVDNCVHLRAAPRRAQPVRAGRAGRVAQGSADARRLGSGGLGDVAIAFKHVALPQPRSRDASSASPARSSCRPARKSDRPRQRRHDRSSRSSRSGRCCRRQLRPGAGGRRAARRIEARAANEAFWRAALGTHAHRAPLRPRVDADGRAAWRARAGGRRSASHWDVVPQMQVTLEPAAARPDQRGRADSPQRSAIDREHADARATCSGTGSTADSSTAGDDAIDAAASSHVCVARQAWVPWSSARLRAQPRAAHRPSGARRSRSSRPPTTAWPATTA